ncbi:MAG: hypothetical protein WKF57_15390 [Nakamurella sp.]
MSAVDVELISQWAARVLEPDRPTVLLRQLTAQQRAAVGTGFSAVRAAVLGEDLTTFEQDLDAGDGALEPEQDTVSVALYGYLVGIAAGIAATGADREPTSLVAGLVTGAAQLRFSWPIAARFGAVDLADRVGLAAADMSGEGADLDQVVRAVDDTVQAMVMSDPTPERVVGHGSAGTTEADDDRRLRGILQGILGALRDVVAPTTGWDRVPSGRDDRSACRPRRFLAEVRFTVDGPAAVHQRIAVTLAAHGTAVECRPSAVEDVRDYHVHTVHPGVVVSEIYAIATPFGLTIDSTEPPLDGTMP